MSSDRCTLETARLVFRKLSHDDHTALRSILGDPETMYAWEYGFTDTQVTEWIDKNLTRYANEGYSYQAAILKETGELVGIMGALNENIDGDVQVGLGYIVAKMHWGRGYATEGAQAWLQYAFDVLGAPQVIADIRPENSSSRRVAERLGMSVVGEHVKHHNGKAMPHLIYARKRE